MKGLLFLDIDGVLIPFMTAKDIERYGTWENYSNAWFKEKAPLVHKWAVDFDLAIVIHSSWRTEPRYDMAYFKEMISDRVIDVTDPRIQEREASILAYLSENPQYGQQFVIIDDAEESFSKLRLKLLVTDPKIGIYPEMEASVSRILEID